MGIFQAALLLAFLVFLLRQWSLMQRKTAALEAILAPYRRGDYAAALVAADGLRAAGDLRQYYFFHGALLWQLGKLVEAEPELKQAVELAEQDQLSGRGARGGSARLEKAIQFGALCNQALGESYIDRHRYPDAEKCFQASLRDWPGHGSAHRALAEICLRRGGESKEALEWAKLSVQEERNVVDDARNQGAGTKIQAMARRVRAVNLGESLSTLAWALAASSGTKTEINGLVLEAVALTQDQAVTSSALVHLHAGFAHAALGDAVLAVKYWREASRIDPQGRCGREARLAVSTPEAVTASK